jgi:D-glycero-D-manno-heptose 1,7-bisphosphate phosphatase
MNKAVFLDRDGTIIVDKGYIQTPKDVELIPGVIEAMKRLILHKFKIIIITNQSAVARGIITEDELAQIHQRMIRLLKKHKIKIDGIYYCPHLVDGVVREYRIDCDCRKPKPGLILRAVKEHNIDMQQSYMVGNTVNDMKAAATAGIKCKILIAEGATRCEVADLVVSTFKDAVSSIIEGHGLL